MFIFANIKKITLNFSLFVSKKYLFSKKTTNVINIISVIAIIGVAFGTTAFIVVLSVFNGIENMVSKMFNSFDPDLRIELAEGKSFNADTCVITSVKKLPEVAYLSYVIQENALLEYNGKQIVATMKAVDDNYKYVTGVDTMLYGGVFVLHENPKNYAVIGYGLASRLGVGLNLIYPLTIWAPKRTKGLTLSTANAFNSASITVSAIFSVQKEYDEKYVIVPIDFARNLMDYGNRATSVELKLAKNAHLKKIQKQIQQIVGKGFVVKNRFQQKQLIYKIMKTEKLAVIAILIFILLVSSFNIIGTMIMLIIEKKRDLATIHSLGADIDRIRKIFLYEGWLISSIGAFIGLFFGLAISLGQQIFGWVKFPTSGNFISNVYPVQVHGLDIVFVFFVVMIIGFLVANYPVRFITKKFFTSE